MRAAYDNDSVLGTLYWVQVDHDIVLVGDGDTLRTKSARMGGQFAFTGIDAKEVTFFIEAHKGMQTYPFSVSFELSPGGKHSSYSPSTFTRS